MIDKLKKEDIAFIICYLFLDLLWEISGEQMEGGSSVLDRQPCSPEPGVGVVGEVASLAEIRLERGIFSLPSSLSSESCYRTRRSVLYVVVL